MSKIDTPSPCPVCGKNLDAATSIEKEEAVPGPGDLSICLYCATVSRFDDNLKLEQITNEEFAELPEELKTSIRKARDTVLDFNIKVRK